MKSDRGPAPAAKAWDYLSTGAAQHVFVDAEGISVYKIPAQFGHVLPSGHRFARFRPQSLSDRVVRAALMRGPNYLRRRGYLNQYLFRLSQSGFTAYRRRRSLAAFRKMLIDLDALVEAGLADVALPFSVDSSASVTLRVDGRLVDYRGPVLVQQRADYFFERCVNLRAFNWDDVITVQHQLWRRGFALTQPGEIAGPKNWGLSRGRLLLAVTSSLTRSFDEAAAGVDKLDVRERTVVRQLGEAQREEPVREYFAYIRAAINRRRLEELWRADRPQ